MIPSGETEQLNRTFYNGGVLPVVSTVDPASDGIETGPPDHMRLSWGETENVTVAVTAPPETGVYLRSYTEYRYFMLLPPPVILQLHAIHPWVAMGAVTGVLAAAFAIPVVALFGTGTIRTRERRRESPTDRR